MKINLIEFSYPLMFTIPIIFIGLYLLLKKPTQGLTLLPIEWFMPIPKSTRQRIGTFLRIVTFFAFIITLTLGAAKPVKQIHPEFDSGRSIFLAIDTSFSMREKDFYDGITRYSRMTGVKNVVGKFVESRRQDLIGISVFGGKSFLLSPLTKNQNFLASSIQALEPGIGGDGTAIGDGLAVALKRLEKIDHDSKAIILLTDGASNSGFVQPEVAAKIAKSLDIKIHTIGIGQKGTNTYDEQSLKSISKITGGIFRNAEDVSALTDITKEIETLIEQENKETAKPALEHYSKYFALLSLCFFTLYLLLQRYLATRIGLKKADNKYFISCIIIISLLIAGAYSPSIGKPAKIMINNSFNTVIFALDVSKSMGVTDQKPNRLEDAKIKIIRSLRSKQNINDTRVGLIAFAGTASMVTPPTNDYETLIKTLETITTNFSYEQGSNIAEAIQTANASVEGTNGVIYLISDGETDLIDESLFAAKNSAFPIYAIASGTASGGNVPDTNIISKANIETLKEIATASKGQFTDRISLNTVNPHLPDTKISIEVKNEIGWVFLLSAVFILFAAQFLKKIPLYLPCIAITFITLTGVTFSANAQDINSYRGMQNYEKQDYQKASEYFLKSLPEDESDWAKNSRFASSLFKEKKLDDALEYFENSLNNAQTNEQSFTSHYNIGNTYLEQKEYDKAIASYDQALTYFPDDVKALTNKQIAMARKKQEPPKQNSDSKPNDNEESPKDQTKPQSSNEETSDSKKEQDKAPDKDQKTENQSENSSENQKAENPQKDQAKQWLDSLPDSPVAIKRERGNPTSKSKQWW